MFSRNSDIFDAPHYTHKIIMSVLILGAVLVDVSFGCVGGVFFLTTLHVLCALRQSHLLSMVVIALCGIIYDVHMTIHFGWMSVYGLIIFFAMDRFMMFVDKRSSFLWVWGSHGLCLMGYYLALYLFMGQGFGSPQSSLLAWVLIMAYPLIFHITQRFFERLHNAG